MRAVAPVGRFGRIGRLLPVLVFSAGAAASAAGGWWLHQRTQADAEAEFSRIALRNATEVSDRFRKPVYGLNGARGVYATHEKVSRETFRRYVAARNLPLEFPGVRGFGFIERVPREALAAFLAAERADAAPQFTFHELGQTHEPDHYIVKFVEPAELNTGVIGLDAGSDTTRRRGLLDAIESGEATLTGLVTLMREKQPRPGALLYVPVFDAPGRSGVPAAPPMLRGVLYAPIVIAELLHGLGEVAGGRVRLELFDSASATPDGPLMYDSHAGGEAAAQALPARFERMQLVAAPGRLLSLRVRSLPAFEAAYSSRAAWLIGLGGVLAAALLAALLRQQMTSRARAEMLAGRMTADLGRLAMVARRTSNAVVITDTERHITWVNEGFERMTGYSAAEALGRSPGALLQTDSTDPATVQAMRTALSARQAFQCEILNRHKDGGLYWLEVDIQPLFDDSGGFTGFMAVESDITDRREAERALVRERRSLQNIVEGTQVGTWEWNVETGETVFNERWAQILGHTLAELGPTDIGTWSRFMHPDDLRQQAVALERHFDGLSEGFECEARMRHREGHWVWVLDRGKLFSRSSDGRPRWLAGTRMDINQRKLAETALLASQTLLNQTGHIGGVGGWAFDLVTEEVTWTDQTCRIFGRQPGHKPTLAEGVGYFSAQAQEKLQASLAQARQTGEGFDLELTAQTADGRAVWVRLIGEVDAVDGRPAALTGAIQDITDLVHATQRAEQATMEASRSLARLQAIYDILPVGLTITDPHGQIIDCNPASERLLGISKAEHLRRAYDGKEWTVLHEDGTPMLPQEMPSVRALTERKPVHDALIQVVTPLSTVWLSVSAMPVQHEDLGVVIGYVDVTEQRAQRQALLEAKVQAEQASVAKSQFLANMSHEIRTPMNAILGMLTLLQKTELTKRQADYATKTHGAARSLLGLLNDILDFSKVEAGKLTLDPHPFRLDQLMRDLGVILSASVGDKPVEVLLDVDPALPRRLVGDAMRLQQVLINLGGNAVKFTARGEVVITVRQSARSDGHVTLQVAVRDTGIGIAPENQARIFSGFTQAEASTTRRFGGTGLGVAISQRLVALMGGELRLTSALGEGSRFDFALTLPVAEDDAEERPAPPTTTALRALVIDDNATAREVLRHMTDALGWTADLADSGEAALELLARRQAAGGHYDAVFVDWQMPGMDGWETARRIRSGGLASDAPLLVMVTAHGREKLEQRSRDEQSLLDGFLVKPVTASMLLDAVADARSTREEPHLSSPRRPAATAATTRLAGMKLLVVEDNLNNQQVARELLEDEGASVQIANNGQEGVEAVAAADPPFDVVLMDLQMPVMDGFTATARIRQDLARHTLPIVAMTANAMASDREACLAAGMNEHVGKPFDLDQLVAVLLRLGGRKATAETVPKAPPAGDMPALLQEAADAAGVDLAAALQRLGGKRPVYARMLQTFVADLQTLPDALQQQLDSGDRAGAARTLHTLKGLAGTLGMSDLRGVAAAAEQALEVACAQGDGAVAQAAAVDAATVVKDATPVIAAMTSARKPLAALLAQLQVADAPDASAPAPAANAAALHHALGELAGLLENFDMQATEAMLALRRHAGAALGARLDDLDDAVGALDFERAAPLCRQLAAETALSG